MYLVPLGLAALYLYWRQLLEAQQYLYARMHVWGML